MTEIKNAEEPTIPTKRKADLSSQELCTNSSLKAPKIVPEETIEDKELGISGNGGSSDPVLKSGDKEAEVDAEEEEEEDGDCEEEDDDEGENGDAPVDRKGKGILIEEDEDSDEDDDDSSFGGDESDGASDLSDDPLAEVDLDNILPSRTRRRSVQPGPGVYIANDLENKGGQDDSDDSDA